jgi:hypothetical protein
MKYTTTLRWTTETETPDEADEIMRAAARCREVIRLVLDRPAMGTTEEAVEGVIDVAEV